MAFTAKLVGIPNIPTIKEVNIRTEPKKSGALLFKAPVGTGGLNVIDVQPDGENQAQGGKVFHWFKLAFVDGQQGWCRDDLMEVQGDGKAFGYGNIAASTLAFNLERAKAPAAAPAAVPVSAAPAAAKPTPAVAAQQSDNAGPGMIICMMQSGANMRPGPGSSTGAVVFRIPYLAEATILGAEKSKDPNDPFQWVHVDHKGTKGWLREDFIRLKGNFEQFGIGFHDMYPSPAPESWWARDFNLDPNFNPVMHHGWDHSGKVGAPILAGPKGGKVIKVAFCQKCGSEGFSAVEHKGYGVSDSRVLQDPGWNYGYGHFVNVTYHHDKLPKSTQDKLAAQGKAGWHISVNYAHLHTIAVQPNQDLAPNALIGTMGTSGNSTGAHLHLEVRAHQDANNTNWPSMKSGLMSPAILFLR